MKNDLLNCQGKKFDTDEYNGLKREMELRINMGYSHGYTIAAIVLVYWAAIFAFCKDLYDLATAENSIIGTNGIIDGILIAVIAFFCGIPCCIVYPATCKLADNIRQMASISAYFRVFYEFPTLCSKAGEENGVRAWEVLHCDRNFKHQRHLALEYFIIALGAIVLTFAMSFILFACIISASKGDPAHYLHSQPTQNWAGIGIGIALCLVQLGFLISCLYQCYRNVSVRKITEKYSKEYSAIYLQQAKELQFYTSEEIDAFMQYEKKIEERDKISQKKKKK